MDGVWVRARRGARAVVSAMVRVMALLAPLLAAGCVNPEAGGPPPLIATWNYEFVPDAAFAWHGPAGAAGVVVWAHGNAGRFTDQRGVAAPPVLRPLNRAGYDVVRFDRQAMADDRDRAAGWLRDAIPALRRMGYRRVVVAGQSRGAWNALQTLSMTQAPDAVIALSPAAHGSGASTNLSAQFDDLRRVLAGVDAPGTRVAVAQFAADPFSTDPDRRAALFRAAAPRLAALLLIDRPAGETGHMVGLGEGFAARYGECLRLWATQTPPPASCPPRTDR